MTTHPQWGIMCEICFSGITIDQCATDLDGNKWDICTGQCAKDAGIVEQQEFKEKIRSINFGKVK